MEIANSCTMHGERRAPSARHGAQAGADPIGRFAEYLRDAFGCSSVIDPSAHRGSGTVHDTLPLCRGLDVEALRIAMDRAPAGVLACAPDARMPDPARLRHALAAEGLDPRFVGWTAAADEPPGPDLLVAVLQPPGQAPGRNAPSGFRVVAFVPTYNEADIISHTLLYLTRAGIEVYVLDNWSTDDTLDRVEAFIGHGVIGIERFPPAGPVSTYEWRQILGRIEALSRTIAADWFVLHDADERRSPPWPHANLRDGLYHVQGSGFTCVDHVVVNFWPTGEPYTSERDVEDQLGYCAFSDHPGHFHQRKAWRNCGGAVSLAASAGHDAAFPGRLVYPYKFLIKHYPVRSAEHARRKILVDRVPRWNLEERAAGWHKQYDELTQTSAFVRDASTLMRFDRAMFDEQYVIQRLSGVGVFADRPPWATGPRQPFHAPKPAAGTHAARR